jgi:hypothetical protein
MPRLIIAAPRNTQYPALLWDELRQPHYNTVPPLTLKQNAGLLAFA